MHTIQYIAHSTARLPTTSLQCATVLSHCSMLCCIALELTCSQGIDENKRLYEWTFAGVKPFEMKTRLAKAQKGNYSHVSRSMLLQVPHEQAPAMNLRATAEYFVNRLSASDRKSLARTMSLLDGKCIRVGSTCSGTDMIIPVMKWTFHTLSRMFNVASHWNVQ